MTRNQYFKGIIRRLISEKRYCRPLIAELINRLHSRTLRAVNVLDLLNFDAD